MRVGGRRLGKVNRGDGVGDAGAGSFGIWVVGRYAAGSRCELMSSGHSVASLAHSRRLDLKGKS